jgi:hypothetical protein
MRKFAVILASFACACSGAPDPIEAPCEGLDLRVLDTAIAPPANVSALLRVTDCDGEPIGRRFEEHEFALAEDGTLLSPYEASRAIIPAERQRAQRTLIALDLSGSIVESGLRPAMIAGAHQLIDALDETHAIAIFGFDGRPDLIPFTFFTSDRLALQAALATIEAATVVDDSTNLNGAVVGALRVLDRAIEAEERSGEQVAHGSLVTFTDGRDLARRVSDEEVEDAVDDTIHSTFAIGVGGEVDAERLAMIARTRAAVAGGPDQVAGAFEEIADALRARSESDYVVSYCSPARAGGRVLTIALEEGDLRGEAGVTFDADGFGAGCSPSATTLR